MGIFTAHEYTVIYKGFSCSLFYDCKAFFGSQSWILTIDKSKENSVMVREYDFIPADSITYFKVMSEREAFDLILSTYSRHCEKLLKLLKEPLLGILMEELALGNQIAEVFADQRLYVILQKPFMSPPRTNLKNVAYNEVNDPHYWKQEYYNEKTWQLLACKF